MNHWILMLSLVITIALLPECLSKGGRRGGGSNRKGGGNSGKGRGGSSNGGSTKSRPHFTAKPYPRLSQTTAKRSYTAAPQLTTKSYSSSGAHSTVRPYVTSSNLYTPSGTKTPFPIQQQVTPSVYYPPGITKTPAPNQQGVYYPYGPTNFNNQYSHAGGFPSVGSYPRNNFPQSHQSFGGNSYQQLYSGSYNSHPQIGNKYAQVSSGDQYYSHRYPGGTYPQSVPAGTYSHSFPIGSHGYNYPLPVSGKKHKYKIGPIIPLVLFVPGRPAYRRTTSTTTIALTTATSNATVKPTEAYNATEISSLGSTSTTLPIKTST